MANFSHFYALCPFSLLKLKFNNLAAEIFVRYSYSGVIKTRIISILYRRKISHKKAENFSEIRIFPFLMHENSVC